MERTPVKIGEVGQSVWSEGHFSLSPFTHTTPPPMNAAGYSLSPELIVSGPLTQSVNKAVNGENCMHVASGGERLSLLVNRP